jgi:L-ribulokinase
MQVLSDVLEMPIRVAASDQGCALGASIFAAVVAGVYKDVPAAQAAMASKVDAEYRPDPSKAAVYRSLYARYKAAGAFIEKGSKA